MSVEIKTNVNGVTLNDQQWWSLYDQTNKLVYGLPQQCKGTMYSPSSLIVGDTEEELTAYIEVNGLTIYNLDSPPESPLE